MASCADHTVRSSAVFTEEAMNTADSIADLTPGIGHAKGALHYYSGQKEKGDNAMRAASRTSGIIIGGLVGSMAGPVGTVAGAVSGGATVDGVTTGVESAIHGEYKPSG